MREQSQVCGSRTASALGAGDAQDAALPSPSEFFPAMGEGGAGLCLGHLHAGETVSYLSSPRPPHTPPPQGEANWAAFDALSPQGEGRASRRTFKRSDHFLDLQGDVSKLPFKLDLVHF